MSALPSSGLPFPLEIGKDFIESFMVDTCTITRDAQGVQDDVLDETTGLLVPPSNDTTLLYSGMCVFKPLMPRPRSLPRQSADVYNAPELADTFRVLVPVTKADLRRGDIVRATTSNDPRVVGRVFRVSAVSMGTLRTYRQLVIEDTTYSVVPED